MKRLLVLVLILVSTTIKPEKQEPLTIIAFSEGYPYSFQLPNGETSGLFVEFWQLWSEINGMPVEFKLETVEKGLQILEKDNVVHSGLFKSPVREETLLFSLPFLSISTGIIYSRKHQRYKRFSSEPLKVGTILGSLQYDFLRQNYPQHEIVTITYSDEAIPLLLNNELDAVVLELPIIHSMLDRNNLNGVLSPSNEVLMTNQIHAAASRNNSDVIELVNQGIENIPLQSILALEKKWLPNRSQESGLDSVKSMLTTEEIRWLNENKVISLATQPGVYPLGFLDEKGEFSGLVGEYVQHIKRALDIEYRLIPHETWGELFQNFNQGNVDLVSAMVQIPERTSDINFTIPYLTFPNVIVTRNDSEEGFSMSSLNNRKVGVADGYLVSLIKQDYPEINLHIEETLSSLLEKLSAGELDAVIDAIPMVNYEIAQSDHHNLIISSLTPYNFELSMAVRKGMEPLIPILNKVISNISAEENQRYTNTWLPSYIKTGVEKETLLLWSSLFMAIIIGIFYKSNRKLNRMLEENRYLARRIVAVQENERKLLSIDLHDDIGQNLTALKLHIQSAKNCKSHEELNELVNTIDKITTLTFQSTQELIHGLRPIVLDDYGLEHALSNRVITQLLDKSGIQYHKVFKSDMAGLNDELTINLYRIAQECITNTSKYSKAKNLYLRAEIKNKLVHLTIEDDGVGFDVKQAHITGKGVGLESIHDRVEVLGGEYSVDSDAEGTKYQFRFPID